MTDEPSRYVRTTITIPQDLKRRMLRAPTVNWSAVACQAFESKLSELTKPEGERAMSDLPPMDDAIERLRRLKNLPEATENPRDFESGFQSGRRWAMAVATPQELGRLETFCNQNRRLLDVHEGKALMRRVALAVTGADGPERKGSVHPKEFWPVKVGLSERPDDCLSFATGFCEGSMVFWKEAKEKI